MSELEKQISAKLDEGTYEPSRGARNAMQLAVGIAQEHTLAAVPLLQPMNQEERIMFFAKLLSVWMGHMEAAIGNDATRAVIDGLKELADRAVASPDGDRKESQ